MINDFFNFCPVCGNKTILDINDRKWVCSNCGFTLYNNVATAVALIIFDSKNNVLFEIREKEPKKGLLAIPGGFCDPDESAEEAAYRECIEEIGVGPESIRYLCSFPNNYEYKNVLYKTCDIFFTTIVDENKINSILPKIHLQKTEVSGLTLKQITSEKDIQTIPIAFESTRKALTTWLKQQH